MPAFCLRILAGMLFRGDDFFGFSFCICNSISLIVTGLNSNWFSSQHSLIFLMLE